MSSLYENSSLWRLRFPSSAAIGGIDGGIPYKILSQTGTAERGQSSITETYIIDAGYLSLFLNTLFPAPEVVAGTSIINNAQIPGQVTSFLGDPRAVNCRWRPHMPGLPVDTLASDVFAPSDTYGLYIEVEVEYRSIEEQDPDRPRTFLDVRGNASGEYLLIMPNKAALDAPSNPNRDPQIPASKIVPGMDWTLTWEMITEYYYENTLLPKMREAIGKVNDSDFSVLYDSPAETVLFMGWSFEQLDHLQRANVPGWMGPPRKDRYLQVTFNFLEKRVEEDDTVYGHNHIWDQKSGLWTKLLVDGSANKFLYESYDMNLLFGD